MTPRLVTVKKLFIKIANEKNIDLSKVDIDWLKQIIGATQMCNFKDTDILNHYVNTALENIPKKAIIK